MIVYVAGRRCGKTRAALSWLLEDPSRTLILPRQGDRAAMLDSARLFLPGVTDSFLANIRRQLIPVHEADLGLRGRGGEIGVDNLEECLQTLWHGRIGFATINGTLLPGQNVVQTND